MIPNANEGTGLPYGVLRADLDKLDGDVIAKLFDLASVACYLEEKDDKAAHWERQIVRVLNDLEPSCEVDNATDGVQSLAMAMAEADMEDYPGRDEPSAVVSYQGVKVWVFWLGGAMHVASVDGPVASAKAMCSPCVPNAADLDGGQFPEGVANFECHGFPEGWLAEAVRNANRLKTR